MGSALIDTSLLLDYLCGDKRAERALAPYGHRSISVVSWLELMAVCPPEAREATRGFLRTFERLSVSESIADEALRLMQNKSGLPLGCALTWASARVNQLPYVTVDPTHVARADLNVVLPYRWAAGRAARKAAAAA
jgi:predicted nucleic acid-binding protein